MSFIFQCSRDLEKETSFQASAHVISAFDFLNSNRFSNLIFSLYWKEKSEFHDQALQGASLKPSHDYPPTHVRVQTHTHKIAF